MLSNPILEDYYNLILKAGPAMGDFKLLPDATKVWLSQLPDFKTYEYSRQFYSAAEYELLSNGFRREELTVDEARHAVASGGDTALTRSRGLMAEIRDAIANGAIQPWSFSSPLPSYSISERLDQIQAAYVARRYPFSK